MKIGMSLYSFGADIKTGNMTIDDALRYCAELGCEGVEIIGEQHLVDWPYTSPFELNRIRKLCESLGLEIFCFSVYLDSLIRTDRKTTFEEYIEMVNRSVAACSLLGSKILRPAFYCVPVESLTELVTVSIPVLEEYGIIWGVELHAPFPPEFYMGVLKEVDSPWFRLIPDFSCWQTAGAAGHFQANAVSTLEPLLKYTVHCHGKAHVFDSNGEEPNTPYQDIIQVLKSNGFKGSLVGEYEGWLFESDYTPSKVTAKTHFELIKRYSK